MNLDFRPHWEPNISLYSICIRYSMFSFQNNFESSAMAKYLMDFKRDILQFLNSESQLGILDLWIKSTKKLLVFSVLISKFHYHLSLQ